MTDLLLLGIGLAVGVIGYGLYDRFIASKSRESSIERKAQELAEQIAKKHFADAEKEARELRESAKRFYERVKSQYNAQFAQLKEREEMLKAREKELLTKEEELFEKLKRLDRTRASLLEKLEEISGLSQEEAKKELLAKVEQEVREFEAERLNQAKKKVEQQAQEYAQKLIIDTLQSIVTDYIDEATVTRVEIPDEKVKGRIIGKDGRNIRALERATGVDVIIDEAPNTIGLSSFDPVRREVARIALENLLKGKRVHPGTIEEQVARAKKLVAEELEKAGRKMIEEAGWYDAPKELYPLLGRMKFRRSLGQNLYKHTLEVMRIAEFIARELKLKEEDIKKLKIAALLHDIGKVFTGKIKKQHHFISADLARKYGLDETIINAIEAHHGDVEPKSIIAEILKIADAVSGARPGARKESLDSYIERVESLEKKALEVAGDKAEEIYAVKAGRELRVIVKPSQVSDQEAVLLARDIAKAIQESGVFPGEVEVVVIREVRAQAKAGKPSKKEK